MSGKHEGAKYLCDQCAYVGSFLTSLHAHKKKVHLTYLALFKKVITHHKLYYFLYQHNDNMI